MPFNENLVRGLSLRFKGERTYLHGTDLFDALVDEINPSGPVSLRLYKPMVHSVGFKILVAREHLVDHIAAFEWQENNIQRMGIVIDMPKNAVPGRYDYDEDNVTNSAVLNDNRISLCTRMEYSFVEKVVALHKVLLNTIRREKVDWWFSRLDLKILPNPDAFICLELATKPGGRLVRSRVCVGGEEVGSIFFSEKLK